MLCAPSGIKLRLMIGEPRAITVEPLASSDLVAVAECIAIDAEAFPYASAQFGMQSASSCVLAARQPGQSHIVGFIAGRVQAGALHLEGLAVDTRARRHGIGRALVRAAVACAVARRLDRVTLHVSVGNRAAIALYEAEGFVVVGRLAGFYPRGAYGAQTDAYEMARPVAST